MQHITICDEFFSILAFIQMDSPSFEPRIQNSRNPGFATHSALARSSLHLNLFQNYGKAAGHKNEPGRSVADGSAKRRRGTSCGRQKRASRPLAGPRAFACVRCRRRVQRLHARRALPAPHPGGNQPADRPARGRHRARPFRAAQEAVEAFRARQGAARLRPPFAGAEQRGHGEVAAWRRQRIGPHGRDEPLRHDRASVAAGGVRESLPQHPHRPGGGRRAGHAAKARAGLISAAPPARSPGSAQLPAGAAWHRRDGSSARWPRLRA
jgi:hypothetical protein